MSMTRRPQVRAPDLTRDCHFNILGPYDRHPADTGHTYTPQAARPMLHDFLCRPGRIDAPPARPA